MSNKNREQRSHLLHNVVASNDLAVSSNNVTNANSPADVANNNSANIVVSNNTDSSNDDVTVSNNTDVAISNSTDVTVTPSDVSDSVAISNSDVTTDNTWDKKEQQYCTTISNMKRTIESLSIKEKTLLDNLTELQSKYKSLEESLLQKIDSISGEMEQYKMERDILQKKIDDAKLTSNIQHEANNSLPLTPHGDTWQPVSLNDIKVMHVLRVSVCLCTHYNTA